MFPDKVMTAAAGVDEDEDEDEVEVEGRTDLLLVCTAFPSDEPPLQAPSRTDNPTVIAQAQVLIKRNNKPTQRSIIITSMFHGEITGLTAFIMKYNQKAQPDNLVTGATIPKSGFS